MCQDITKLFIKNELKLEEVEGKRVIEIGSKNENGEIRPDVLSFNPGEYVGIDIIKGEGVDIICDAEEMLDRFGKEGFDIGVTSDTLEHVVNWKKIISNMKNICRPNGIIFIAVPSIGSCYHPFPVDNWRYEMSDLEYIFSDCEILLKQFYPESPECIFKIKKPENFKEINLEDYKLYNINENKRI